MNGAWSPRLNAKITSYCVVFRWGQKEEWVRLLGFFGYGIWIRIFWESLKWWTCAEECLSDDCWKWGPANGHWTFDFLFPKEVSSLDFQVECTDRTVQYKLNAQSLRLFGLHSDVNDAHRAGANRLQNRTNFLLVFFLFFSFLPFSHLRLLLPWVFHPSPSLLHPASFPARLLLLWFSFCFSPFSLPPSLPVFFPCFFRFLCNARLSDCPSPSLPPCPSSSSSFPFFTPLLPPCLSSSSSFFLLFLSLLPPSLPVFFFLSPPPSPPYLSSSSFFLHRTQERKKEKG